MKSEGKKGTRVMVDDKTYNVIAVRDGGMGRVWLLEQAFSETINPIYKRRIAVKTFDFVTNESLIEKELNIWISLQHHAILPLLKIGRLNYRLAAIMPRMGGSMDDLLEETPVLSEKRVARIIYQIALALKYAWKYAQILHLDIKPSNVLYTEFDPSQLKVADWGISRLTAVTHKNRQNDQTKHIQNKGLSITNYSAGTPLFMSPERFSGQWELSPAADIYSLGLMAIQLNTGILPFRFGQIEPYEEIITGGYYDNARAMLDGRSKAFRRLCLNSIHPNPRKRISGYRQFLKHTNSVARA